jgi:hypothetical protein
MCERDTLLTPSPPKKIKDTLIILFMYPIDGAHRIATISEPCLSRYLYLLLCPWAKNSVCRRDVREYMHFVDYTKDIYDKQQVNKCCTYSSHRTEPRPPVSLRKKL